MIFELAYELVEKVYGSNEISNLDNYLTNLSEKHNISLDTVNALYTNLIIIKEHRREQNVTNGKKAKGWHDGEIRILWTVMELAQSEGIPVKQAFDQLSHVLFKDKTAIWTQFYAMKRELKAITEEQNKEADLEDLLAIRKTRKPGRKPKAGKVENKTIKAKTNTKDKQLKEKKIKEKLEKDKQLKEKLEKEKLANKIDTEPKTTTNNESQLNTEITEDKSTLVNSESTMANTESHTEAPQSNSSNQSGLLEVISGLVRNMNTLQPKLSQNSQSSAIFELMNGLYQLSSEAVTSMQIESEKEQFAQSLKLKEEEVQAELQKIEEEKKELLLQAEKEKEILKEQLVKQKEELENEMLVTKNQLSNLARTVQNFEGLSPEETLTELPNYKNIFKFQLEQVGFAKEKKPVTYKLDKHQMLTQVK
ncbi:hypothetical protein [Bacillus cereus]|uniref:Uncharacterized protein n=1 Tax=Bacillus cereus TaxID=1396 RepID=A0A164K6I4_BACCE|nr:hypothetical protein [Bacillus cereus]KZD48058.1 hypothetical protein B4088_6689 [Bacillus cereus]